MQHQYAQWVQSMKTQGYSDAQIHQQMMQMNMGQMGSNQMSVVVSQTPDGGPDGYSPGGNVGGGGGDDDKMKLAQWIVQVSGNQYQLETLLQYPLNTLQEFASKLSAHLNQQNNNQSSIPTQQQHPHQSHDDQSSHTQTRMHNQQTQSSNETAGGQTNEFDRSSQSSANQESHHTPNGGSVSSTMTRSTPSGTPDPLLTVKYLFNHYPQIGEWLRGTNAPYYQAVLTSAPHASAFIQQMIDSQPQFRQIILTVQNNVAQQAAQSAPSSATAAAAPTSARVPARSAQTPPIATAGDSKSEEKHKKKKDKKKKSKRKERKKSPKPYRRSSHDEDLDYDDGEDYRPKKKKKKSKKNRRRKQRMMMSPSGEDTGSDEAFSEGNYSDSSVDSTLRDELESMLNEEDDDYQPTHDVELGYGVATRKSLRESKKRNVKEILSDEELVQAPSKRRKTSNGKRKSKHNPTVAPTEYTLVRTEECRFGMSLILKKEKDYYHETLVNLGTKPFTMDEFGQALNNIIKTSAIFKPNALKDIEDQITRYPGIHVMEEATKEDATKYSCEEYLALIDLETSSDVCMECGGRGYLVMCDSCPRSFHPSCVNETEESVREKKEWFCPECVENGALAANGDSPRKENGAVDVEMDVSSKLSRPESHPEPHPSDEAT